MLTDAYRSLAYWLVKIEGELETVLFIRYGSRKERQTSLCSVSQLKVPWGWVIRNGFVKCIGKASRECC